MEAFDQYWRKPPAVKRLVFRVIPDESTRLAALKRGEIDIVYSIRGDLAEELRRTAELSLKPAVVQVVFCLYFPTSGTRNRPGMTSGCGAPLVWRSLARARTRR
jgi:peptide/nickel transport system substrate-binding protein